MILPELKLLTRSNKKWLYSGIDSIENCIDQEHFKNYPHAITYEFNSRGFRDSEWPESLGELQDSIWCIGDSFTVGLGAPLEHTWVYLLQKATGRRCINISLDGASNAWMARRATQILETIKPKYMVFHWSHLWRGEDPDCSLSDEQRRLFAYTKEPLLAIKFFKDIINSVDRKKQNTIVYHSVIPNFGFDIEIDDHWNKCKGPAWPSELPTSVSEFELLPDWLKAELELFQIKDLIEYHTIYNDVFNNEMWIKEFGIIDHARDGWHYDKLTATLFVNELLSRTQFD